MTDYVQISAQISEATRNRLDLYARETGLKKSRIIEDAIEARLNALEEVPIEYVGGSRFVLDDASWEWFVQEMEHPSAPSQGLIDLLTPHRETLRRSFGYDDD